MPERWTIVFSASLPVGGRVGPAGAGQAPPETLSAAYTN